MARNSRARIRDLARRLGASRPRASTRQVARVLFKSRLLLVFLALCALGIVIGLVAPPESGAPEAELFREMSVVSFRDSPADTTTHFVVDLCAGGRPFRRYDVDAAEFSEPPRARDYNRAITGTVYRPLEVRGHVAQGMWLDVPRAAQSLLPGQLDELYRATLDFVKPVSMVAGFVGTLSGYSIGYRLGAWNHSLQSRTVQERLLATPGLGPAIAREAWRRVLVEPLVTGAEDDVKRFAATAATQRIYTNFFRLALDDSDGFIPREAARLAQLGHDRESRAMLAFAAAVVRAERNAPVTSADFDAVERWASLLVRRGHWALGTIPPAGEERERYLGMLAWYGVAPPSPESSRIWIGPRLLVREGDLEGFVTDEVPSTSVGCPAAWRAALERSAAGRITWAEAWLEEHAEFHALAVLAARAGSAWSAHPVAARPPSLHRDPPAAVVAPPVAVPVADARMTVVPVTEDHPDSAAARPVTAGLDTLGTSAHGLDSLRVSSAPTGSSRADSVR